MANENRRKIDANTCRLIGIVIAGVVAAGATWLLLEIGFPVWLAIVGFVIIWAILGIAIDGKCAAMASAAPSAPPAAAEPSAMAERAAAEAERAAAEQAAPATAESATDDAGGRPEALEGPRGGQADDLKKLKGIGPKLEKAVNGLGVWHYDQIAAWTAEEVAWVDDNLEGIKGRATRDEWVRQAAELVAAKSE